MCFRANMTTSHKFGCARSLHHRVGNNVLIQFNAIISSTLTGNFYTEIDFQHINSVYGRKVISWRPNNTSTSMFEITSSQVAVIHIYLGTIKAITASLNETKRAAGFIGVPPVRSTGNQMLCKRMF